MAFLVLEGLDGSGKSTQIRLLRDYLDKKDIICKYMHFPRTGTGIFGELIAMFLRGELGKIDQVNPRLVSLIYAADRHDASIEINDWLSKGNLLLADRYVISNVAYQCAKLNSEEERTSLSEWIFQLEYSYYGIPKPDLNIFLDVPFEFTREKLNNNRKGSERNYLKGNRDIHEADLDFQQRVREVYMEQSRKEETLKLVTCFDRKKGMLSAGEIHSKVISLLKNSNFL